MKLADVTPYLEGVYISYGQAVPVDISVKLCSKLSRLQFLRWDAHKILVVSFLFFSKVENILESSKFLLYKIRIFQDDLYSDEDYRKLFTVCPSLRVVCHCTLFSWPDSSKSNVYFCDPINKKVMFLSEHVPYLTLIDIGYSSFTNEENRNILYTFAEPRIARHTVDWLKF